jgi:diphosphomevalonate decarboxylase
MKSTAVAPANIAFTKYCGKTDDELRLPANPSFSMNLDNCVTTTTVEFDKKYTEDSFEMISENVNEKEKSRALKHVDRMRNMAQSRLFAKIVTKNSFPKSAGIASSASGFAALAVSVADALGLNLSEKELSVMARIGSGSACRSIPDGFVEWKIGKTSDESYAHTLFPPDFWDLRNIVAIVKSKTKKIPTTEGMEASRETSIFYQSRINAIRPLHEKLQKAFGEKDFKEVGEIVEKDCIYMHSVMMTTMPPLFYWTPETLAVIQNVIEWREEGIESYFTIDAGPNVHIICEAKTKKKLVEKIKKLDFVEKIISNKPTKGAHLSKNHLF